MNIALAEWDEHVAYRVSERAYLLYTEGHFQESLTLFEGLLEMYPENLYYRDAVSALYLSLGNPAEAVRQASIVLEMMSTHVNGLVRRAEGYVQLGLHFEAAGDVERLRQLGASAQVKRLEMRLQATSV